MVSNTCHFYDKVALTDRLTSGVQRTNKPVVFLVGAALTSPIADKEPGVPGVSGVIELIRDEFCPDGTIDFERAIEGVDNPYQAAFLYLIGRRGQQEANNIVKQAVWQARRPVKFGESKGYSFSTTTTDDACRTFDADCAGWFLTPGVQALGQLAAQFPERFGQTILTTNFDPLIGVSVAAAGGVSFRTVLHRDGNLGQTTGDGCHIIHLHGYWYGSDTLHTPRQLTQERPRLKASLSHLLQGRTLVVSAYGGWDDVFIQALVDTVADDLSFPEIAWTFYDNPNDHPALLEKLGPGLDRGRIALYGGVDCHELLPAVLTRWQAIEEPAPRLRSRELPALLAESAAKPPELIELSTSADLKLDFHRGRQDRPPEVDFYVGREAETTALLSSDFSVAYITGIGGQGKSALASRYFLESETTGNFDYCVWRDCKEQGERFERQVISIVEVLGGAGAAVSDLASASMQELARLLVDLSADLRLLMVFDNIDHYVDLEGEALTGPVASFTEEFLLHNKRSSIIFTCRPSMSHEGDRIFRLRLEGLEPQAAIDLFKLRGAAAGNDAILHAHSVTKGHAFWLNLLAAQVAQRVPRVTLEEVLDPAAVGHSDMPTATLESIWRSLKDREQVVLRGLAESVRPLTDLELSDILRRKIHFNQVSKALRNLKALSLIVTKAHSSHREVLELHPLVRSFIRGTFAKSDRAWYIDALIGMYSALFGLSPVSSPGSTKIVLEHWTEATELYIERGKLDAAFKCLSDVGAAFSKGSDPHEFIRVAGMLFEAADWSKHRSYPDFDEVFGDYFNMIAIMGRSEECLSILEKYEATVPRKDARYINLCNMNCYYYWLEGNYLPAIKWGSEGVALKKRSNVDTTFDSAHNLALAHRDAGMIDQALTYFLRGAKLDAVVDPNEYDKERGGHYYGNIGRCLHLMGQIDPALTCYRKSAIALERSVDVEHVGNQGYVRQWIGELLLARGDRRIGLRFLLASYGRWILVAPPKAQKVRDILCEELRNDADFSERGVVSAENFVRKWIYRAAGAWDAEDGPLLA